MQQASLSDVPQLVRLMAEFYAESGYPLDTERAEQAFDTLLNDERLGRVRPGFQRAGLGTAALNEARAFCVARGVRALHLEVEQENAVAQSIYRKAGFVSKGRQLLLRAHRL